METEMILSLGIGLVALSWTMFQQYRINEMCAKCPFRLNGYAEKEKEK